MTVIFKSEKKGDITTDQLLETLKRVGASDCDVLYLHTDMSFGLPALKRKALLEEMYQTLCSLGVKTLVFPTFTFSFCNKDEFDVLNTPTRMGALNEYVRKSGYGERTEDPLLSVYVVGDKLNLVDNLGRDSIGINSNYDRIHSCGKDVKFLFLGADMRECFTYTHYMEAIMKVPYRYNREFSGVIIDKNGNRKENESFNLYSSYGNVVLNTVPVVHNEMLKQNMLNLVDLGDGQINCFSENDAYQVLNDLLAKNIFTLTDGSFKEEEKNTIYNPSNGYVVSVK